MADRYADDVRELMRRMARLSEVGGERGWPLVSVALQIACGDVDDALSMESPDHEG